jgi:hypothetical protein
VDEGSDGLKDSLHIDGFDRIKAIFRPKNQLSVNQTFTLYKVNQFIPLWEK